MVGSKSRPKDCLQQSTSKAAHIKFFDGPRRLGLLGHLAQISRRKELGPAWGKFHKPIYALRQALIFNTKLLCLKKRCVKAWCRAQIESYPTFKLYKIHPQKIQKIQVNHDKFESLQIASKFLRLHLGGYFSLPTRVIL